MKKNQPLSSWIKRFDLSWPSSLLSKEFDVLPEILIKDYPTLLLFNLYSMPIPHLKFTIWLEQIFPQNNSQIPSILSPIVNEHMLAWKLMMRKTLAIFKVSTLLVLKLRSELTRKSWPFHHIDSFLESSLKL